MKRIICALLLICITQSVQGRWNFTGNPDLPYPPGCAGDPGRTLVPFLTNASIELRDRLGGDSLPVRLDAFRATCSEFNRSVIWLRFSAHGHVDRSFVLEVPVIRAVLPSGNSPLMSLVTTPNGWGTNQDPHLNRRLLAHTTEPNQSGFHNNTLEWTFLLDNTAGLSTYPEGVLSAEAYNGPFTLHLFNPPDDSVAFQPDGTGQQFPVPATAEMFGPEAGIPLSGRLSGLWVMQDANDQGLTVSISNRIALEDTPDRPRESLPLVLFLAHYTYDAQGKLLWLTGAVEFEQGSQQVSIPIVRVEGGEFMGDTPATRTIIGSVRLVANSCNDLTFEYDYSGTGLGTGSHRLQRAVSLEIAGHECRDYAARQAAATQ